MDTSVGTTYEIDEVRNKGAVVDIQKVLRGQSNVFLKDTNPRRNQPSVSDLTVLVRYPMKSTDESYLCLAVSENGWYVVGEGIVTDDCKEVSVDIAVESILSYRAWIRSGGNHRDLFETAETVEVKNGESLAGRIELMVNLQNTMNSKVNPDWTDAGYEWYRALWVECAEMLDHHGWKWWKHQECDVEQVKLELVDIFHFGLSMAIISPTDTVTDFIEDFEDYMQTHAVAIGDFCTNLEALAGAALVGRVFDIASFANCMDLIGMDFDELYKLYVAKNTLNMFRQSAGYKEGTYIKVWDGKEDNEVLMELVANLPADEMLQLSLYTELHLEYTKMQLKMHNVTIPLNPSDPNPIGTVEDLLTTHLAEQKSNAVDLAQVVDIQTAIWSKLKAGNYSHGEFINTSNEDTKAALILAGYGPNVVVENSITQLPDTNHTWRAQITINGEVCRVIETIESRLLRLTERVATGVITNSLRTHEVSSNEFTESVVNNFNNSIPDSAFTIISTDVSVEGTEITVRVLYSELSGEITKCVFDSKDF